LNVLAIILSVEGEAFCGVEILFWFDKLLGQVALRVSWQW